jgi:hypothetical protein
MGMFKDLREITRMGKEMRQDAPMPGMRESVGQMRGMMEDAQSQLAAAQLMQDPNARPGTATIRAIRDTGMTVNENPSVEFDLQVTDAAGFTYDVTHTQIVSRLQVGALQLGATVNVMIDSTDRNRLAIV